MIDPSRHEGLPRLWRLTGSLTPKKHCLQISSELSIGGDTKDLVLLLPALDLFSEYTEDFGLQGLLYICREAALRHCNSSTSEQTSLN